MEEYHFCPSDAREQSITYINGGPMGVAGQSAGSPAGLLLEPASTQPPIANQGGVNDNDIPIENRSLIDWISFSFKTNNPREVLAIIGLDPSLFTEFPYGFSGYHKSLRFGNISIFYNGREDMGCLVDMSGQGCRQLEAQFTKNPWLTLVQTALSANANFTRIDLAIDNVDGALTLDKLWIAVSDHDNQVRTRFSEWQRIQKGCFLKGEKVTGETIYLGSNKSHTLFRVYNKADQLGIDRHWIRFELRLRDKRAQETLKLFISGCTIGNLATGIINNYFAIINSDDSNISRCTLQSWWLEWLQSTEKISLKTEKAIKYVSDSMKFVKRQCAPTLAMIKIHLGPKGYQEFIREVDDDGRERMGTKHEQILAVSAGANHERKK